MSNSNDDADESEVIRVGWTALIIENNPELNGRYWEAKQNLRDEKITKEEYSVRIKKISDEALALLFPALDSSVQTNEISDEALGLPPSSSKKYSSSKLTYSEPTWEWQQGQIAMKDGDAFAPLGNLLSSLWHGLFGGESAALEDNSMDNCVLGDKLEKSSEEMLSDTAAA